MIDKKELEKHKEPREIIDYLYNSINTAVGYNVMVKPEETVVKKVLTGIASLDIETGGGFPRGRAIILVGEKSTFKSSLLYLAGGRTQRVCGNCMTGHIKEVNKKIVTIDFSDKSEFVAFDKKTDAFYSTKYFEDNIGNLFCPGEKIPKAVVDRGKLKLRMYELECDVCDNPSYSIFALLDNEHNYTKTWARRFGVINFYTTIAAPLDSQQSGDILREMLNSGRVSFIGVDSLDALGPIEERTNAIADQQMGLQARVWNKITRSIHSYLNRPFNYVYFDKEHKKVDVMFRPEPMVVIISQFREKIGVMFGDNKVMGGGRGKDFLSAITVELSQGTIDWIEEKMNGKKVRVGAKGMLYKFFISKNKVAKPFSKGFFYFDFKKVNNIPSLLYYGEKFGILKKAGAWYYFENEKYQGEAKITEALLENPKLYTKLYKEVMKKGLPNEDF